MRSPAVALPLALVACLLTAASVVAAAPSPSPTAAAVPSPGTSPSPATTPGASHPSPTPSTAPPPAAGQQLVADVRARLGTSVASALSAQLQLTAALQQNTQQQEALRAFIQAEQTQIAQLDAAIETRQKQITVSQAHMAAERAEIAALARAISQQPTSPLDRLLRAGSLEDALIGTADTAAAGQRARQLEASLAHDLIDLRTARDALEADRERATSLQTSQQQVLGSLQQLQAQEERTRRTLAESIHRTELEMAVAAPEDAQLANRITQELQAEQTQLVAAAQQEAWTQAALWLQANPVGGVASSSGHSAQLSYVWPLPSATMTQGFGPTSLTSEPPFAGYAHFHTGIDLAAPEGSPVLAAADGVVAAVASGTSGYGSYVVLAHGQGIATLYGHLDAVLVKVGDRVARGQPIGLEGSTGNSTGPHCHFEVRVNGQPVDPTPFLPPGPPRS